MDDVVVEYLDVAGGDGAEGEFFVAGDAELADGEDVECGVEVFCDFGGDGNAAAREGEDEEVFVVGVVGELGGELAAGVGSVEER